MEETVEDCCVGCLTNDENKFSHVDATGLLQDFMNRELTRLFKHIPAILCSDCLTKMDAYVNFKDSVENCISELEKRLPAPPATKGRGRPKKLDSEKKNSSAVQNGHAKSGRGRGRPKKDGSAPTPKPPVYHTDDEGSGSNQDEEIFKQSSRKRKNLVYDISSSDSEEWSAKKPRKYIVKVKLSGGSGKRGRPKKTDKVERRGRPRKNIDESAVKKTPVQSTSSEGGAKKRGRPKKITNGDIDGVTKSAKQRGRPKKIVQDEVENEIDYNYQEDEQSEGYINGDIDGLTKSAKKRGRPKKIVQVVDDGTDQNYQEDELSAEYIDD